MQTWWGLASSRNSRMNRSCTDLPVASISLRHESIDHFQSRRCPITLSPREIRIPPRWRICSHRVKGVGLCGTRPIDRTPFAPAGDTLPSIARAFHLCQERAPPTGRNRYPRGRRRRGVVSFVGADAIPLPVLAPGSSFDGCPHRSAIGVDLDRPVDFSRSLLAGLLGPSTRVDSGSLSWDMLFFLSPELES